MIPTARRHDSVAFDNPVIRVRVIEGVTFLVKVVVRPLTDMNVGNAQVYRASNDTTNNERYR